MAIEKRTINSQSVGFNTETNSYCNLPKDFETDGEAKPPKGKADKSKPPKGKAEPESVKTDDSSEPNAENDKQQETE